MIAGLTPPAPLPFGWRWWVCTHTVAGALRSLHVPAASAAEVEPLLAELTADGVVDGELKGWLDA